MIFQPKNYGSMNLHCSIVMKIESRYMLRRLRVDASHGMNSFVTVDEVANAQEKGTGSALSDYE